MANQKTSNNPNTSALDGKEFNPKRDRKNRRAKQQSIRALIGKAATCRLEELEDDIDELEEKLSY